MNPHRLGNVLDRVRSIERYQRLDGLTVLEIGADWQLRTAGMLLEAGAARVVATNVAAKWPERELSPRLSQRWADARSLHATLPEGGFDVIFGVAVLEHVHELERLYDSAYRVLRPGGLFHVHGGPLWSHAKGHHVWVTAGERSYRFSDDSNPIPNWHHLIHDAESLFTLLVDRRGVPPGDAARICRWVYDSDGVNRIGYAAQLAAARASRLQLIDTIEVALATPPAALLRKIRAGRWGDQKRYDVANLTVVARR